MKVTYAWIWPGQPGGYQPVLGEEFATAPGVQARLEEERRALRRTYRKPRQDIRNRSIPGISKKADAAVAAYRKKAAAKAAKQQAPEHV